MSKSGVRRSSQYAPVAFATIMLCFASVSAAMAETAGDGGVSEPTRVASINTPQSVLSDSLLASRQDETPGSTEPSTGTSGSSALPLFAGGLALIGFLAWRRKSEV